MSFFKSKHILLISVSFFNYEQIIKEQLVLLGASVDLFDERPSNSFFSKAILRIRKELYGRSVNKHFRAIIDKIRDKKYDYFLLIKGEATPRFFLEFLRKNNPDIILIYYTYDSFKNNSNALGILNDFDRKFTFDRNDATEFNLSFRPLFFAADYAKINIAKTFKYNLSFIGTAHSDRYKISQKMNKLCENKGLRMFNFYYSPSKILFRYKKVVDRNFKAFDKNKISFRSLSHGEIIEVYNTSQAILDINHPGQSGLTMRTFEVLGAGRKLVTTNQDVKYYPFYNENNIFLIDRDNPEVCSSFFDKEFQKIDDGLLFSMSMDGWLNELFDVESKIWNKI